MPSVIEIANNPAGRLREIFNFMHADGGEHSVQQWWEMIKDTYAPDADRYAVRAEAAALLRDVDVAIRMLPPQDDPDSYDLQRADWSHGIFAWRVNFSNDARNKLACSAEALVPLDKVRWLTPLSSLLSRDAPESDVKVDDQMQATLDRIRESLALLLGDVLQSGSDIPAPVRSTLVTRILTAQDDVNLLNFRGWRKLHTSTAVVEGLITAVGETEEINKSESALDRVQTWIERAREICVDVERIVVPVATGLTIAITTGDVVGALGGGVVARGALEAASARGRSFKRDALPPSSSDES